MTKTHQGCPHASCPLVLVAAVLACSSGRAKPDWIQQTLVTVDVTGTWWVMVATSSSSRTKQGERSHAPVGPSARIEPNSGGRRMTATRVQVWLSRRPLPRERREQNGETAASEAQPGFLEWVTRLVHTHRGRLYGLARQGWEKRIRSTAFKTPSRLSSCCHRPGDWLNRTTIRSSSSRFSCGTTHGIDDAGTRSHAHMMGAMKPSPFSPPRPSLSTS